MSQSKVFSDYKSIRASIDAPFEDTVNMIDAVYEGLRVKAQKICDDWWDIKFRKELDIYRPVKNSILGTRIKTNQKGYFYCEWYYNSFSTINGKKKVYSNAIRSLKNGHSVNLRSLKSKMKDWEIHHTMYTEREYQKIRDLASELIAAKAKIQRISEKYTDFYANLVLKQY